MVNTRLYQQAHENVRLAGIAADVAALAACDAARAADNARTMLESLVFS